MRATKIGVSSVIFASLIVVMSIAPAANAAPAAAQRPPLPIILWAAGDLYAADAARPDALPQRLTDDGTLSAPRIAYPESHSSGVIAVKQLAPIARAALDRVPAEGFIAEYDLPADIALYDVGTGTLTPIATQPNDAALFVDGVADRAFVRSAPVFSFDRRMIFWTELDFGTTTARVRSYALDGGAIFTLTETIPIPLFNQRAPDIRTPTDGYAVFAAADAASDHHFAFYNHAGLPTATAILTPDIGDEVMIVEPINGAQLGVLFASGRWAQIDIRTGAISAPAAPPVLTINNGVRLDFAVDPDLGMYWETRDLSDPAAASGAFPGKPGDVALSPDGGYIAFTGYPSFGGAAIWRAGAITPLAGTGAGALIVGAILWSDATWNG